MKNFLILNLLLLFSCSSTVPNKKIHKLNAGTCVEGTTRMGYASPTALGDASCIQNTQVCVSGTWQGPELYESCLMQFKSCGGTIHGATESGYQSPTSPHGTPCTHVTRTCINGSWSGPEVFPSCSELP